MKAVQEDLHAFLSACADNYLNIYRNDKDFGQRVWKKKKKKRKHTLYVQQNFSIILVVFRHNILHLHSPIRLRGFVLIHYARGQLYLHSPLQT